MHKKQKISILGSGNVAYHLSTCLYKTGLAIDAIYSRNIEHARELSDLVNAIPVNEISKLPDDSDLYLVAISDNAIESTANKLNKIFGRKPKVVHTSGMVSSSVFDKYFNHYGVFYPLQTFTKKRNIDLNEVPFFITANTIEFETALTNLATRITSKVNIINDNDRKVLHVAAIFSNNFTNFMYRISKEITEKNNLNFEHLFPLIKETSNKILDGLDPAQIQTGPAIRNDKNTIKKHILFLEKYPDFKDIYILLTDKIQNLIK